MSQPAHTVRPPGSPPTGELTWFFRPFPKLPEKWRSPLAQDQLLCEYLTHQTNFAHFAATRGLTVDQLFDWLHSEEVIDRKKRMAHLAEERAALLLRLARPAAIDTLARTMSDPNANPKDRRLAASALLRAAQAQDRAERESQPVPRVAGSSAGSCRPPQTSPPRHNPVLADPSARASTSDPESPPKSSVLARIGSAPSAIPPTRPTPTGRPSLAPTAPHPQPTIRSPRNPECRSRSRYPTAKPSPSPAR